MGTLWITFLFIILELFSYSEASINTSTEVDKVLEQLKEATFADLEDLVPGLIAADNHTLIYYPEFAQYNNESQLLDALSVKNPELFNAVDNQNQLFKNATRNMDPGARDFLESAREKFMMLSIKHGSNPNQDTGKKIFIQLITEYKQLCSRSKKALKDAFPRLTQFLTENMEIQVFIQFLLNFLPFFEAEEITSFSQLCNLCPNKCPKPELSLD